MSTTPTLVQHIQLSNTGVSGSPACSQLDFVLPNPALSGNCIGIAVNLNGNNTVGSPTDDAGNTWPAATVTANDAAGDGGQAAVFILPNCIAGTRHITIPFPSWLGTSGAGGAGPWVSVIACEWAGIALTSPVDGVSGHGFNSNINDNATAWTTGSITPNTNGDLIWVVAFTDTSAGSTVNTSWAANTAGFTLLSADIVDAFCSSASMYLIQTTAAAINPAWTLGSTNQGYSLCVALKAATAGTLPPTTGIRIVRMQWQSNAAAVTTYDWQFPTSSAENLFVAFGNLASNTVASLADSGTDNWVIAEQEAANVLLAGAEFMAYEAGAAGSASLTGSITAAGSTGMCFCLVGITGAAVAPLGNTSKSTGQQTSNGSLTTFSSFSPSQANSLVMCYTNWEVGTGFGCNGILNGMLWGCPTYPELNNDTGGSGPNPMAEDAGLAYIYTTSTSPLNFTFSTTANSQSGVEYWNSVVCEFLAATPTATAYAPTFVPNTSPVVLVGTAGSGLDRFAAWIAPAGVTGTVWECYGAGGSGARKTSTGGGGGGGGGSYARRNAPAVTAGNTYCFAVPCGGTNLTATVVNSLFDAQTCDDAGTLIHATSGAGATNNGTTGGAVGGTNTGDVTHLGGAGAAGGASDGGGGGGGCAGTTGAGTIGTAGTTGGGGAGGAAGTGGTYAGAGGAGHALSNGVGVAGNNYGAGGGGSYRSSGTSLGSDGAPGVVIITFSIFAGAAIYGPAPGLTNLAPRRPALRGPQFTEHFG
jgi:hypothetical protein